MEFPGIFGRIKHNKLHHTFTNIHDMDPDVGPVPILRFSPDTPMLKVHKFKHIYAWFFYGLMSLSWAHKNKFDGLIVRRSRI